MKLDAGYPAFMISDVILEDANLKVIIVTIGFKLARPYRIELESADNTVFSFPVEFTFRKVKANAVNVRYMQEDKEVLSGTIDIPLPAKSIKKPATMKLFIGDHFLEYTLR